MMTGEVDLIPTVLIIYITQIHRITLRHITLFQVKIYDPVMYCMLMMHGNLTSQR